MSLVIGFNLTTGTTQIERLSNDINLNISLVNDESEGEELRQVFLFNLINNSTQSITTSSVGTLYNRIIIEFPDSKTIEFYITTSTPQEVNPGESRSWRYDLHSVLSYVYEPIYGKGAQVKVSWKVMDVSSPITIERNNTSVFMYKYKVSEPIIIKL